MFDFHKMKNNSHKTQSISSLFLLQPGQSRSLEDSPDIGCAEHTELLRPLGRVSHCLRLPDLFISAHHRGLRDRHLLPVTEQVPPLYGISKGNLFAGKKGSSAYSSITRQRSAPSSSGFPQFLTAETAASFPPVLTFSSSILPCHSVLSGGTRRFAIMAFICFIK